jgi:glycosyltransferase involved in cell wall biosynthesis
MRICKIWDADYPWDIRVEKVVSALALAGHSVDLVCRNQARRKCLELNGSLTIRRLPSLPPMLGPLHAICNFPFPLNPVWITAIASAIRHAHADLILVRDLPLALPAAMLGRAKRIPVVLDMAEHYPAMLQDRLRYTPTNLLGRLIRNPSAARFIERLSIRLVDHIIVVVEESRDRLIRAGYPRERLTVVSNTPRQDQWDFKCIAEAQSMQMHGLKLVYLGNLDGIRGIDIAIHALRHLKDQGCGVHLTVIGGGPNMPQLRELARQTGVLNQVEFVGHLSLQDRAGRSRVQTIIAQSDIGLIPHYATEACNSTISNKLFDYMMAGLPVIVSDMKPTARIVMQEGCGEVFKDRDPVDLARCVIILTDPQVRKRKGLKGQAAISRRYHWNYDSNILVETLEMVQARYMRDERPSVHVREHGGAS